MTRAEAEQLLTASRALEWDFPSSAGRPLRSPDATSLERRHEFASAMEALDTREATELAANTWRLWMAARDIDGGRTVLGHVLDERRSEPSPARALALYGDGLFAFWQGDRDASRRRNEEALTVAAAARHSEALALAEIGLSRVAIEDGDSDRARELATSARAHVAPLGEAMSQAALHSQAQAARLAGEYEEAATLFEESLALNRRIDDRGMVTVELHNLGHVEIRRGNVDAAETCFAQIPPADDVYGQAMARLNDAVVAFARDDSERAGVLLGQAEQIFHENGMQAATDDQAELDRLRDQLTCAAS